MFTEDKMNEIKFYLNILSKHQKWYLVKQSFGMWSRSKIRWDGTADWEGVWDGNNWRRGDVK